MNVYPVRVGIVAGGVKSESYSQDDDISGTFCINVLLLYQRKFIVFASQFISRFAVALFVFIAESLHDTVVVVAGISGVVAKETEIKTNNVDKKLSSKLHVCVCVCVCVCV